MDSAAQSHLPRRMKPNIFVVTDPGPDPDDVKALVVAALLHVQKQITLVGVVANGGGQARARARLTRCILQHMGLASVPVGVGSQGAPVTPQPHEFMLEGLDEVDDGDLCDGQRLLATALTTARPQSVTVLIISSMRDVCDFIDAHGDVFKLAVCRVAIQGGLEPSDGDGGLAGSGYRLDSASNNEFDRDAARAVYGFCFANGIPMNIVSRNAVPKIPMQLARSFALKSTCPIMKYLANAQLVGLLGVWRRVCAGEIPARCTHEWFMRTFTTLHPDGPEARALVAQGADAPITTYLDGNIKPFDVVCLMTVLPLTAPSFPAPLVVHVGGASHRLYLTEEHMVASGAVMALLRDVYHEVVRATTRAPSELAPTNHALETLPEDADDSAAPHPAAMALASGATTVSDGRWDDAASVIGAWESMLDAILEALYDVHRSAASIVAGCGLSAIALSLAAYATDAALSFPDGSADAALNANVSTSYARRVHAYVALAAMGMGTALLSLFPLKHHARRIRRVAVLITFGLLVASGLQGAIAVVSSERSSQATTAYRFGCSAVLAGLAGFVGCFALRRGGRNPGFLLASLWASVGLGVACLLSWVAADWTHGIVATLGLGMAYPGTRPALQRLLVRLVGPGRGHRGALALGPLLRFGSAQEVRPSAVAAMALEHFRPLWLEDPGDGDASRLFRGAGPQGAETPPAGGAGGGGGADPQVADEGGLKDSHVARLDAYVCHSELEDGPQKAAELLRWVGTQPGGVRIWERTSGACRELRPAQQATHALCYMAYACKLVVICGRRFMLDLPALAELFLWLQLGKSLDDVVVLPLGTTAEEDMHLVAGFDAYSVQTTLRQPTGPAPARLWTSMVQAASPHRFNHAIRRFCGPVAQAVRARAMGVSATAVADVRPPATEPEMITVVVDPADTMADQREPPARPPAVVGPPGAAGA